MAFIDDNRSDYGVEPICQEMPIAPSTYYLRKSQEADPDKRSTRAKRDEVLLTAIERVWHESNETYGARKIWKQMQRESIDVARCTVERLMRQQGIQGIRRGKLCITTTPAKDDKPQDLVNRRFKADYPNQLWVADITYVRSRSGFVYVAFVVDVFSRYIVGWRVMSNMETPLVLDAFDQALWARGKPKEVVHHSDHGSQYLSLCYTKKLIDAGFKPSVGTVGDSYDNALAETVNGLYKTELIHKDGPWQGVKDVEMATLHWVDWFNL